MPSTIKLRIIEARDLPVMDRKSGLTDAYVSLSFGEHTDKTSICRKTLHPKWDHLFRIDVPDDTILQDEPIRLTVLDKDVYSSDNTIGVVILDLNCLLVAASELKGWYPIFDTLRGVRGYLCVQVKLQFFGDVNPFKSTAAGVVFFCASRPSESEYEFVHINGFCEELIMAADPEYHWADSFRTSRTSNEARMLLLHELASTIRRSVGSKALEMGANAVVAYRLEFDFEGEGGIIARGLGTACTIERRTSHQVQQLYQQHPDSLDRRESLSESSLSYSPSHAERISGMKSGLLPAPNSLTPLPYSGMAPVDVDLLSLLNIQRTILKGVVLLTITYLPENFDLRIGGIVSARSVKILAHKNTDKDLRDKWWQELRNEIRSHARSLNCHVVLGYSESSSIIEGDVCVLSAIGTAVQCDLKPNTAAKKHSRSVPRRHTPSKVNIPSSDLKRKGSCAVCHITYSRETAPFRMNLMPCVICGKHLVPDMLLATIIPGKRFEMAGGCRMVEARIVRSKRKCQGEANATLISETIPFIEFDLHRQLMYKLRLLGMNAAFGLRIRLTVGDNLIVAIANATATFLPALPLPPVLRIARSTMTEKSMVDAQDLLVSISDQNISKHAELLRRRQSSPTSPDSWPSSDESDEVNVLDDDQDRQAVVLQIDDEYDEDVVSSLLDPCPPDDMFFMNTDGMGFYHFITADLGSMTAFRRISCHVPNSQLNHQLSVAFHDMQAQLAFSVRHSRPVALTCMQAQINIPDDDEIDIIMTAQVVRSNPNMDEVDGYNEGWPRLLQFPDKPAEFSNESFDLQVSISALEVCPAGMTIVKCLGRVHLHFINERWLSHDEGGLARYTHQFLAEAHSVLRANVAARGGNCLLNYSVNQFSIAQPRRDQVYCVISVSGDAVLVHHEEINIQ